MILLFHFIQFIGQFNKEGSSLCTTLRKYCTVSSRQEAEVGGVENPNCGTKLERNQVHDNPRAFEDFGTIAEANYVSAMRLQIQYYIYATIIGIWKFLYKSRVF